MEPSPSLSRRALLGAAAACATLPPLLPQPAQAAARWRTMPEPVTRTLSRARPVAVDALGGMTMVPTDPIPRAVLADGRVVIHPTQLGNLLNAHLDSYAMDGRREHLTLALKATEALMKRATMHRGAAFLGYEFEWHRLPDPWFSAFGQSKFPRVLYMLGQFTGERRWDLHREQVLNAFRISPNRSLPSAPWIAGVDSNNCLWLEEYPAASGKFSTVFNGHFYAMAELAGYVTHSKDARAADLVQGAAATLDHYRNLCRSPGRFSNYYANIDTQVGSYHWINASCYVGLFQYCGVSRLASTVDLMAQDWPFSVATQQKLRIRKVPQLVTQRFGQAPVAWTPSAQVTVDSHHRSAIKLKPGVWARMENGPKAGWWIMEKPAAAYCLGTSVDRVDFQRSRQVVFAAGVPITGYRIAADGNPLPAKTKTLPSRSFAHSATRARVGGAHHMLIQDGAFAGLWVPENGTVHYR